MPDAGQPRAAGDPPPSAAHQPRHSGPTPTAPPERWGPLAVERGRKADGRLLILYFRAAGAAGDGDG